MLYWIMNTLHIIVSGRVQGVSFRAYTQKQAIKNDISGFVRNKMDGNVEIVACGEQEKLDYFVNWCHKGPIFANVRHIVVSEYLAPEKFTQFDIL